MRRGCRADQPLDWEAMLAEAETLAAGDADLLGVIDDIRAETAKGVASGPITASVRPGGRRQRHPPGDAISRR